VLDNDLVSQHSKDQYNGYGSWYGHQQQDMYQQHDWYPPQHQQEYHCSPTHQDFYNAAMYMQATGVGGFPPLPTSPASIPSLTQGLNVPGSLPGSLASSYQGSYPGSLAGSLPPSLPGSFPPSPAIQGAFAPPPPPLSAHQHPGNFPLAQPQQQSAFTQLTQMAAPNDKPVSHMQPAMYTQPPVPQVVPPANKENVVPPPKNLQKNNKDSKEAVKPQVIAPQVIAPLERPQVIYGEGHLQ
jgi:hypothetical protein